MGLILDSSVLIDSERKARPISKLLRAIRTSTGETEVLISAITVLEIEHALWRATSPEILSARRLYLNEIYAAIRVVPFTKEMAQLAARIDAAAKRKGGVIPLADLQIGVTALHFEYAVGTLNTRHFQMIPGLRVSRIDVS